MQNSSLHNTIEYYSDDYIMTILLIIITNLSKEPEYICEYCGRVYKQEARYNTHIREHTISGVQSMQTHDTHWHYPVNTPEIHNDNIIMELLKQNRDMMDMLKQQQDTITILLRHSKIIA